MQLYLPIAEVSVNAFLLLGLGGIVGFLSGMFGVGGGFLITPLLFFIGIPPAVAVATGANQVVASSISGVLAQLKRKAVDFRMGAVLTTGGFVGSALGSIGLPGYSVYSASKFGVHGFAHALRRELSGSSVKVQYIGPRSTDTGFNDPAVVAAIDEFGAFAKNDAYVAGGAAAVAGEIDQRTFDGWPRCFSAGTAPASGLPFGLSLFANLPAEREHQPV